jgi:two-component system chemotaxis response regulator CheY
MGPAAGGAVLVVDDEPSARLLVRTLLERRGYVDIEAEDGVAALQAVGDGSGVGLVVADLNMPRMDGLELIWELRDAHSAARLPVIVVTGEADEILETQLMEEGADDYIRKPIDPRLFLARVESTVRRLGARVARIESELETG